MQSMVLETWCPQGDVYSYGILVLETVTEKRPTDSTFRQGSSLREYVDVALQNRARRPAPAQTEPMQSNSR
jgi:hypothetical protein